MAKEGTDVTIVHCPEVKFKQLNILVNNASKQIVYKDLTRIDLGRVGDIFQCSIIQMIAMAKDALPYMSRGDSIINTTSVVTLQGLGMVDYAATKGANVGFTKSLAVQLIPKEIRVNAVVPGAVYTAIQLGTRQGWGLRS
ncbi:hypothetical protein EYZ11_007246 [Aspergillus tanneri]|uniref:Uncharacterized protein n=1 Tax=Aspergillus tanneri TaxID=1220188 RepID=A0A4S3JFT1_9EURO|nr:hypothetical protein EYZ11_007246 [Aspergillus tanneri]